MKYNKINKFSIFLDRILENKNRIYFISLFFIMFFLVIIQNLFSYTVLNFSFYKNLADNQQIWEVIVPVTRWTIYSATNSLTVLWTSLNLYDIAVDPMIEWDINRLEEFLVEVLYKQICFSSTRNECYEWLIKLLRVLEIEDFVRDEEYIRWLISNYLKKKLNQKKVTSVLIDNEFDNNQIEEIKSYWFSWVYITWNYLYINPEEISNNDLVSKVISDLSWIEKDMVKHLIRKRNLRYIPIINKVSISVSEFIKQYLNEESEAIKKWLIENKNTIWGFIILSPNPHRYYPEKWVASSIIWFVNNDWKWYYWIEGYFNDTLKGNNWKIISKKDVKWRIINAIDMDKQDFFSEWVSIYTTIDRNIQRKVENILERGVKKYRANKWTIVIMEPKTWKIISMANYPSYNLNDFWSVYDLEKVRFTKYPDPKIDLLGMPVFVEDKENGVKFIYDSKEIFLRKAIREELWDNLLVKYKYKNDFWPNVYKNDAISSLYEPWSIMKALTVAIWLDIWEINENSMYMDEGEVNIDNFHITNVSDKCLWYHSFAHALNYSCNVWMIRISQKIWKVLFYQYFNDFWFSELTWISLDWEVTSKVKPWERWSRAQLFTSSYGLWVSITPLQMANAYSVLANWWIFIKPRIIDYIEFPDWKIIKYKKEEQRRVIKKSTSKIITSMLVNSVNNWVAQNWKVEWFSLAWKTWTSQIPYRWKYEKWVWSTIGSFAWYWPAEDPQFVIIVKLDRPRTVEYWWQTSAFLFSETSEYLFDYYWIPKKEEKVEEEKIIEISE